MARCYITLAERIGTVEARDQQQAIERAVKQWLPGALTALVEPGVG